MEKGKIGMIIFLLLLVGGGYTAVKYFQGKIAAVTCQEDLEAEIIQEVDVNDIDAIYDEVFLILDRNGAVYDEDNVWVKRDGSNLVVDIEAHVPAKALFFTFEHKVEVKETLTGRFGGPISISGGGAAGSGMNRGMRGISDAKSLKEQSKGAGQDLSE